MVKTTTTIMLMATRTMELQGQGSIAVFVPRRTRLAPLDAAGRTSVVGQPCGSHYYTHHYDNPALGNYYLFLRPHQGGGWIPRQEDRLGV